MCLAGSGSSEVASGSAVNKRGGELEDGVKQEPLVAAERGNSMTEFIRIPLAAVLDC